MTLLKKVTYLLLAMLFFACSSEHETKTAPTDIIDSNEIQSKFLFREALKDLDIKIKNFKNEKKLELSNDLIIGQDNNGFVFKDENIKELISLQTKRVGLLTGYDIVISEFDLLKANDNNGYPMLIVKGYCNQSKEVLSVGLDLLKLEKGYSYRVEDPISSVVCAGCRRGCNPKRDSSGDGYCTDCKISNSNCTKTETL